MKKSRIAKLSLMGASIAALAATLTTSTYAWYVSNKTAEVTASTGSTASASSDGSISVSTTGEYGTFYKKISLGNFTSADGLIPVKTTDGMNFTKLGAVTDHVPADAAATIGTVSGSNCTTAANVYHYQFYILADANVTVTPKVTITNTTSTYTGQVNYATTTNIGDPTSGQTFYVNALDALTMTTRQTPSTATYAADYTFTAGTPTAVKGNQLSAGMATTYFATTTDNAVPTPVASQNAIAYYEEITGNNLTAAQELQYAPTAIGTFNVDANKPQLVEYWLFLDGADAVCFNACEKQTFSVAFNFSAADRS